MLLCSVSSLVPPAYGVVLVFSLAGKVNNDVKRLRIVPENRSRGWYLNSGIYGNLKMRIIPYKDSFNPEFVLPPLAIAAHWGGIGAKTQHGYGVVELFDSSL